MSRGILQDMQGEDESSVEALKRKLYTRGGRPQQRPRRELHEREHPGDLPTRWGDEVYAKHAEESPEEILTPFYEDSVTEEDEPVIFHDTRVQREVATGKRQKPVGARLMKAVFFASFFFFLFAAGIAGYFLFGGRNQVSCNKVALVISGPHSIASGKQLSLDVSIQNNNPVPMRNASLQMYYPESARNADDSSMPLPSSKDQIGTIELGEQVRTTSRMVLFGREQEEQEVRAELTYAVDDSNASFTCKGSHRVMIATSPVSVTVNGLEEISSGQEVEFEILIASNSEETVPDQRLVVSYPFGFTFTSSDPEPTHENNVWDIGDVAPSMERVVTVRGVVEGQGTESRVVGFTLGGIDTVDATSISGVLQKIDHPLLITRPFLELSLNLNDSNDAKIVSELGETIKGTLTWKNTLSDAVHDLEIDAVFSGAIIEKSSVVSPMGFYRSIDNTITWTPQTTSEAFRQVEPGEEGSLDFTFTTRTAENDTSLRDPQVQIELSARARRISDSVPVPQSLSGQAKRTIVFNTDPVFDAYALYKSGPFSNTGPIPLKVDKRTTFTIVWSVKNSINALHGIQVTGVLPVYVDWLNTSSPSSEQVNYNPVTREVTWVLDTLPRRVGYGGVPAREMSFQVAFTPSASQVGETPDLVFQNSLEAIDDFTGAVLERSVQSIDTELQHDPYFNDISSKVTY